jgi:hypothetical protein
VFPFIVNQALTVWASTVNSMTSDHDAAARKEEEEEKETFVEDSSHKWNTFKERKVKRTKGVWKRKAQTGGAGCKSRTKSIDRRSRYSYYQRLTSTQWPKYHKWEEEDRLHQAWHEEGVVRRHFDLEDDSDARAHAV